jgi:hypothetical protein
MLIRLPIMIWRLSPEDRLALFNERAVSPVWLKKRTQYPARLYPAYYRPNGSWLYEGKLEHVFWGPPFISAGLGATFSGSGLVPCARDKPSYLEVAGRNRDADPDEAAGSVEADKTLGDTACGSDKSADLLFLSSIPKGNLGPALRREPAYEDAQDE